MSLCRMTVLAFKGHDNYGYDSDDLVNGIAYADDLLEIGFTREPHDDFDLRDYISWARARLKLWEESGEHQSGSQG